MLGHFKNWYLLKGIRIYGNNDQTMQCRIQELVEGEGHKLEIRGEHEHTNLRIEGAGTLKLERRGGRGPKSMT